MKIGQTRATFHHTWLIIHLKRPKKVHAISLFKALSGKLSSITMIVVVCKNFFGRVGFIDCGKKSNLLFGFLMKYDAALLDLNQLYLIKKSKQRN